MKKKALFEEDYDEFVQAVEAGEFDHKDLQHRMKNAESYIQHELYSSTRAIKQTIEHTLTLLDLSKPMSKDEMKSNLLKYERYDRLSELIEQQDRLIAAQLKFYEVEAERREEGYRKIAEEKGVEYVPGRRYRSLTTPAKEAAS